MIYEKLLKKKCKMINKNLEESIKLAKKFILDAQTFRKKSKKCDFVIYGHVVC